jgi:hypothetical protein
VINHKNIAYKNTGSGFPFDSRVIRLANKISKQSIPLKHRPSVQGITIDAPRTRILDQGFWVEYHRDSGRHTLYFSVTDVASVIPFTSSFSDEAKSRAVAHYGMPLFPKELVQSRLSLQEKVLRPVVTIKAHFGPSYNYLGMELVEAKMKNHWRFNFNSAWKSLSNINGPKHHALRRLWVLAEHLRKQLPARTKSGAMTMKDMVRILSTFINFEMGHYFAKNNLSGLYWRMNDDNKPSGVDTDPPLLKYPAYVRFTAPLQQYEAFINHHVVKQHMEGSRVPFLKPMLKRMALMVNNVRMRHKIMEKKKLGGSLTFAEELSALTHGGASIYNGFYSAIISMLLKSSTIEKSTAYHLLESVLKESVYPSEILTLLMGSPPSKSWNKLRQSLIHILFTNPLLAFRLVKQAEFETDIIKGHQLSIAPVGDDNLMTMLINGKNKSVTLPFKLWSSNHQDVDMFMYPLMLETLSSRQVYSRDVEPSVHVFINQPTLDIEMANDTVKLKVPSIDKLISLGLPSNYFNYRESIPPRSKLVIHSAYDEAALADRLQINNPKPFTAVRFINHGDEVQSCLNHGPRDTEAFGKWVKSVYAELKPRVRH